MLNAEVNKKNVVINYEDMTATSDKAYALLDKNGDVKNLKLSSHATIKQNKSIIKGDNIQYSKLRRDIIVSGNTISDVTFDNGDIREEVRLEDRSEFEYSPMARILQK